MAKTLKQLLAERKSLEKRIAKLDMSIIDLHVKESGGKMVAVWRDPRTGQWKRRGGRRMKHR